jgi:LmbE family N-acetylglucosaminyl deacetylase
MIDFPPADRPVNLATFDLSPPGRLLMLAPHPDDFDVVAVTLRRFQQTGWRLRVAVLTGGAAGVEGPEPPATKAARRETEQRDSARRFGLTDDQLEFLRLAEDDNGELADLPANETALRQLLAQHQPDLLVLPHGHDTNAGHRVTFALTRRVAPTVPALLTRDPKTIGLRVDAYTPFDDATAAWKAALLRCHASQQARNLRRRGTGFDERILAVNRVTARELNLTEPFAEAFEFSPTGLPRNDSL